MTGEVQRRTRLLAQMDLEVQISSLDCSFLFLTPLSFLPSSLPSSLLFLSPIPSLSRQLVTHMTLSHQFSSIAAVTNITHLVALNSTNVSSDSCESQPSEMAFTGLKSRLWECCISSGGSRKESLSLAFSSCLRSSVSLG